MSFHVPDKVTHFLGCHMGGCMSSSLVCLYCRSFYSFLSSPTISGIHFPRLDAVAARWNPTRNRAPLESRVHSAFRNHSAKTKETRHDTIPNSHIPAASLREGVSIPKKVSFSANRCMSNMTGNKMIKNKNKVKVRQWRSRTTRATVVARPL